jgi:hypothetical protein
MKVNDQFIPQPLYHQGKIARYLQIRKMGRPQCWFWALLEEEYLFFLPGIALLLTGRPFLVLVIISTEL